MKNIVLMGVPRAGKSTFARMILENYKKYSLIQSDIIEGMYLTMCRQQALNESKTKVTIDLSIGKEMTKSCFEAYIDYEPDLNFILDTSSLDIESMLKYIKKGYIVIVFGYPDITVEEKVKCIIENDNKSDWTYIESEETIKKLVNIYIERSKEYQCVCKEYNVKFVDTSQNREEVLNDLMFWLKEHNN